MFRSLFSFVLLIFAVAIVVGEATQPIVIAQDKLTAEEQKQIKIAERFFSILEKSPRRGTALDRIYGHHVEFGTLDAFIGDLQQRVEKKPEDGTGWMLLGMFEAQRGQDGDAVDAFKKAVEFRPDDALPSYYLGQSLLLIGQPAKAVEAFEEAIRRKPRRSDVLEIFRQLGRVHQRAQRTEEALQVWDRMEGMFPNDVRVQEQIAVTMVDEGEFKLALPRYEKLVALVKDNYRKVTYKIEVAELKIRQNQKQEGLEDFELLLSDLNPTGWLFRDVRKRIEEVFLRTGDQDGLVTYYENWIQGHPEDVGAMSRLAKFLTSQARLPEASKWMEKALELAPSRQDLRRAYISQLKENQQYQEASKQYQKLVESSPGNPDYIRDWGRMVLKNKEIPKSERESKAIEIWNRIIAARPDDALSNSQVADLCRQSGMSDEAIRLYEKAIELAPAEPQYREYLGEYFHILKRREDALNTWRQIAIGDLRTAENVARLAEVFNSFGYLDEAIGEIATACELEPEEFTLQSRAAEYHMRAGKYDEAIKFIDNATQLAANDEEADSALRTRIEIFQASRKLEQEIERIEQEILASADVQARDYNRLARYLEANRQFTNAIEYVEKALEVDPKSIPSLTTFARITELSGDYAKSAEMNRQLADVDRRSRSEHLMNVARLHSQLGETEKALEAGRELIVSAPGNTDNYEFYSQLCFENGKTDVGLDSLRKAVRINPTEPHLTMALGGALANEFRTDEAIEVYWRAFDKCDDLEDKLALTEKLAQLYDQKNQSEKLLEKFERDRNEEANRREMTICIAQVHQTLRDYGSARRNLESLLSENTRDTNLLQQISKLCERSNDLDAAISYQRQLVSVAPSNETEYRLATLLQSRGDQEEASELLVKLTGREEDPVRLLKSIDSLIRQSAYDSAIKIIEPLLAESRDQWELIYREAIILAAMDKQEEASIRLQQILDLNLPYESMGIIADAKHKRALAKSRSNNLRGVRSTGPQRKSPLDLVQSVYQVKSATGLVNQNYYGNRPQAIWAPEHYGVARMACFGWMLNFEREAEFEDTEPENGKQQEEAESVQVSIEKKGTMEEAPREAIYDLIYLYSLLDKHDKTFEVAKTLAKSGSRKEKRFFLNRLRIRSAVNANDQTGSAAKKKPLSEEDIELMLSCYKELKSENLEQQYPGGQLYYAANGQVYIQVGGSYQLISGGAGTSLGTIIEELELGGKDELANQMLKSAIDSAKTRSGLLNVVNVLVGKKQFDELPPLFEKWAKMAKQEIAEAPDRIVSSRGKSGASKNINQVATFQNQFLEWTAKLAAEEENDQVLQLLDQMLDIASAEGVKRRSQRASSRRRSNPQNNYYNRNFQCKYGDQSIYVQLDYPQASTYVDDATIFLLRQAYEVLSRNDVLEDLPDLLGKRLEKAKAKANGEEFIEQLYLGFVAWWQEEKEAAVEYLTAAANQLGEDADFRIEVARLHMLLKDFDSALEIIEQLSPRDRSIVQKRELMALDLSERVGDFERAKQAADRLFGLRLKPDMQAKLVPQLKRLGMLEKAQAITSRMQRRSGSNVETMATLMSLYQGQGKTELAEQIAKRILQRTKAPTFANATSSRALRYSRNSSQQRSQALKFLTQTGALDSQIEKLEKQLEKAPESTVLYEQLIEFYEASRDKEKAQELLVKATEAKPDTLIFRYKLAKQQYDNQKYSDACDNYLYILKKKPKFIVEDFNQVTRAFQSAKRSRELMAVIDRMNLKNFGQPWQLTNFVQNTLSSYRNKAEDDEFEIAIRIFEKVFDAFPNYQNSMLSNIYDERLWKNEKIYKLLVKGFVPAESVVDSNPWHGVDQIYSYRQNGNATSRFGNLIKSVVGSDREKDVYDRISKALEKMPKWRGGTVMLALIDVANERSEQGKQRLTELMEQENVLRNIPQASAWIIGQELEKFEDTQPLALELFEVAVKAKSAYSQQQIQYSPLAKLVDAYAKQGKKDGIRELVVSAVRSAKFDNYGGNYGDYMKLQNKKWAADKLVELDLPVDALLLYREILNDDVGLTASNQYGGGRMESQVEKAIRKAFDNVAESEDLGQAVASLLSFNEDRKKNECAFDLMLAIPKTDQLREKNVTSQLLGLLNEIIEKNTRQEEVLEQVHMLKKSLPQDLSVNIIDAYLAIIYENDRAADAIASLKQVLSDNPMDSIAEGRRPNSRQRKQAGNYIPLWLVARKCLKNEEFIEAGNQFAMTALEASRRQIENQELVALLYEWGKFALENGDKETAENRWNELLEEVTAPLGKKPKKKSTSQIKKPGYQKTSQKSDKPIKIDRLRQFMVVRRQDEQKVQKERVRPLTLSQFKIVIEIAKGASKNKMPKLAKKAMRKALKGGMPVKDLENISSLNGTRPRVVYSSSSNRNKPTNHIELLVTDSVTEILKLWEDSSEYPASEVYELIKPIVFSEQRPTEILMYANSAKIFEVRAESLGRLLVDWADQANQLDDLVAQVAARESNSAAVVPALVIKTLVELKRDNEASAKQHLADLASKISDVSVDEIIKLACHAALPAFRRESLKPVSISILDRVLESASEVNALARLVNRYHANSGDEESVRQFFERFSASQQKRYSEYGADYGGYLQWKDNAMLASEAAATGLFDLSMDYVGRVYDFNYRHYGAPDVSQAFGANVDLMRKKPAQQQYEFWKTWTLPAKKRKTIRLYAAWNRDRSVPERFKKIQNVSLNEGFESEPGFNYEDDFCANMLELIGSAKQLGKTSRASRRSQ